MLHCRHLLIAKRKMMDLMDSLKKRSSVHEIDFLFYFSMF